MKRMNVFSPTSSICPTWARQVIVALGLFAAVVISLSDTAAASASSAGRAVETDRLGVFQHVGGGYRLYQPFGTRIMRVVSVSGAPNSDVLVPVELAFQGEESQG